MFKYTVGFTKDYDWNTGTKVCRSEPDNFMLCYNYMQIELLNMRNHKIYAAFQSVRVINFTLNVFQLI